VRSLCLTLSLFALVACDEDTPEPMEDAGAPEADAGGGMDAGLDAGAPPAVCEATAGDTLPSGLETLSFHSGEPAGWLGTLPWSVGDAPLSEQHGWEQARFEVDRPMRIHGFRVRWGGAGELPPDHLLEAGLYRDFGHNGFDMWTRTPLYSGSRCASELDADGWATYAFDEPVEYTQPGLVYVGHERAGATDPGWMVDATTEIEGDSCGDADFDHCRAAINLPDADPSFYNGITLWLQWDYYVELFVEPLADPPATTHFTEDAGLTLSNRVSFGDYDHDGWDDFVTTGPRLYHNDGDGTFTDVTDASGLAAIGANGQGIWGDYDNDGCLDLFVFSSSLTASDRLVHGECDGTFTDATEASGITDVQGYERCGDDANVHAPTVAAAWIDLDEDGDLDLYLANYECSGSYYGDNVFINAGDGTFIDRTGREGFGAARYASRAAAPIDADRDGHVDLLVGRYRLQPNSFFRNLGDGREVSEDTVNARGLAGVEVRRAYGHTIGYAWGDLDGDGDFDLIEANLAHPRFFDFSDKLRVLLQGADGVFSDNAGDWIANDLVSANGIRYQETHSVPSLADFDRDGDLDLVVTCVYAHRPTELYWGNGDGTFELDVLRSGITTENGWGVATSDWDHDGDVDVAARSLFTNEVEADGHWLSVRVIGDGAANWAAIGATVEVTAGSRRYLRHVQGGTGQGCQDSMYLHFGIAAATTVDSITVTFPGGDAVTYDGPFDADQRLWLMQTGAVHEGWAPPSP